MHLKIMFWLGIMIPTMLFVLMDTTAEQSTPRFVSDIRLDLTVEGVAGGEPGVLRVGFCLPNEQNVFCFHLKGIWELNKQGFRRNISYKSEV